MTSNSRNQSDQSPATEAGDDNDTLIDVLAVLWKFLAGALGAVVSAVTLLSDRPEVVKTLGVLLIVGGVVAVAAVVAQPKRHARKKARALGIVLGGLSLVVAGGLVSGLVPGVPSMQSMSESIAEVAPGVVLTSTAPEPAVGRGRYRLTVEASSSQAEAFAAAVQRQISADLDQARVGADARQVEIRGTASGAWRNAAARLFAGQVNINMRAEGSESVCALSASSTGQRPVDAAARQISEQLTPRILAVMGGEETC